jgi:hypothetical protein
VRPRPVLALVVVGRARLLAGRGGARLGAAVRELDKVFGGVVDALEVVHSIETTVEVVHVVVDGALLRCGGVALTRVLVVDHHAVVVERGVQHCRARRVAVIECVGVEVHAGVPAAGDAALVKALDVGRVLRLVLEVAALLRLCPRPHVAARRALARLTACCGGCRLRGVEVAVVVLRVGAPVLDPVEAEEVDAVLHLRAESLAVRDVAAALVPRRIEGGGNMIHTAWARIDAHVNGGDGLRIPKERHPAWPAGHTIVAWVVLRPSIRRPRGIGASR